MAGKRVAVIAPDGQFGTVDETELEQLPDGARVLTQKQVAERAVQERYDALPTAAKALGVVNSVAGLATPLTVGADHNAPPTIAAIGSGIRQGLTAGLADAGTRKIVDAVGGKAKGDQFAEQVEQEREASPIAHEAGNVVGMAGGAMLGPGAGAARALPSAALSSAGSVIEHGVAKALGGLATRGALGRAATTGATMAVRGAVEGAAYAGIEDEASAVLHDTPETGEKLYGAMGHGAAFGGLLGGGIGVAGSLVGSGAKSLLGRSSKALAKGEGALPSLAEAPAKRGVELPFIDADAGLKGPAPLAESPISMGAERRPVQLKPGGRPRLGEIDEPIRLKKGEPVTLDELFTSAGDRPPSVTIDPDAGLASRGRGGKFQGKIETEDALKLSSAKKVGRNLDLNVGDELGPLETRSPIKLPEAPAAPAKPKGIMAALSDPNNAARDMAHEQAWSAIGRGNGLQTTRYAKQAQKYFGGPDGTKALGEVAIRHGLIDMGAPTAGPVEAAWAAAKSGTVADIAPKAEIARETVGRQIGEITDASGARVKLADIDRAIAGVRQEADRFAGNEHVVSAIDSYADSLRSKLAGSPDGTVRIQDLLEQRKGLDAIVYKETKSMDPGRRVQALRDVRTKLEDVIGQSLDDASGQVPGALRDKYAALKKDYHALSILSEAAEDGAARASKGATFGLGEKIAIGGAIASGSLTAAPVLAAGGKMLRERGSAAAAAFLSRAADRGTFASIVRQFDMKVSKAAAGVLRESNEPARHASPKPTGRPTSTAAKAQRAATNAEAGREAIAEKRAQGQQIVKWVGEVRANPKRLMEQLEEAAERVGQTAGPAAAESYTGSTLRAIQFIAGHVPVKDRRDPLDPRSVPPLTFEEAERLIRAAKYATQPGTVFDDFERGKVTPEGLRAAKTFMPGPFAEFQAKLQGHVEEHMMGNRKLTQSQRLRIDKLLGYPAGANLRPEAIQRNQANYAALEEGPQGPAPASPAGNGPVNLNVQQSGFDAVEARASS